MFLAIIITCLIAVIFIGAVTGSALLGLIIVGAAFFMTLPTILKYVIFFSTVDSIKSEIRHSHSVSDLSRDKRISDSTDRLISSMKKVNGGKKTYVDKRKLNVNIHK